MKKYTLVLIALLTLQQTAVAENPVAQQLFNFHSESAKSGNPESMYILGNMYESGRGVKKDYNKALEWYAKAAKQGNLRAFEKIEAIAKKNQQIKQPTQAKRSSNKTNKEKASAEKQMQQKLEKEKQQTEALKAQLDEEKLAAQRAKEEADKAAFLLQQQLEVTQQEAERARREAEAARIQQQTILQEKLKLEKIEQQKAAEEKPQKKPVAVTAEKTQPEPEKEFKANPCTGPTARFMSTCR
ncbi:hypothetical protein [Kaarinaea lacus]